MRKDFLDLLDHPDAAKFLRHRAEMEAERAKKRQAAEETLDRVRVNNALAAASLGLTAEEYAEVVLEPDFRGVFQAASSRGVGWNEARQCLDGQRGAAIQLLGREDMKVASEQVKARRGRKQPVEVVKPKKTLSFSDIMTVANAGQMKEWDPEAAKAGMAAEKEFKENARRGRIPRVLRNVMTPDFESFKLESGQDIIPGVHLTASPDVISHTPDGQRSVVELKLRGQSQWRDMLQALCVKTAGDEDPTFDNPFAMAFYYVYGGRACGVAESELKPVKKEFRDLCASAAMILSAQRFMGLRGSKVRAVQEELGGNQDFLGKSEQALGKVIMEERQKFDELLPEVIRDWKEIFWPD